MKFDYRFYIISLILILFTLYFLYLIIKQFFKVNKKKIKRFQKNSFIKNIIFLLLFFVFLFLSTTMIFFFLSLKSYNVFTHEKDVARIRCVNINNKGSLMEISVEPIDENIRKVQNKKIRGDLWAVDSYILKWHPLMNLLGFKTHYKILSVYGKYEDVEKERNKKHDVLLLAKRNDNKYWIKLLKNDKNLFFIKSVYGSSIFQYPSKEKEFLLKISRTGLTLEKRGDYKN
ncbi:MAG: hypothetical protein FXF47_04665 [Candidatus Mcinerneyibacterium aminivorans]|uniref:Uncharacterized protein n=1 Tax=Candidatus Mcinerneyibacterium aminivorans TaxID=2703815 RepID=A0A5D0MHF3_9BACT|nr:MAG: hypothetical protein FXF47_04665 [Candidatus Mcinerneyibacterium aminivorans]